MRVVHGELGVYACKHVAGVGGCDCVFARVNTGWARESWLGVYVCKQWGRDDVCGVLFTRVNSTEVGGCGVRAVLPFGCGKIKVAVIGLIVGNVRGGESFGGIEGIGVRKHAVEIVDENWRLAGKLAKVGPKCASAPVAFANQGHCCSLT